MTEFQVYWWMMLDNINDVSGAVCFMVVFTTIILIIAGCSNLSSSTYYPESLDSQKEKKIGKILLNFGFFLIIPSILTILIYTFIPTSKQYAMIKCFPKIANSEVIAEDVPEMYQMVKDYMKEMLEGNE